MGQARARVSQCSPVFYLYRTFSFPASSSLRHFPLSSRASSVEPRSCNWRVVVLQCGCCLMKVAGRCSGPVHLHRWPSRGPLCPVCNSENISFAEENECDRLFVKVVVHAKNTRTIFLPRNTSTVLSLCVLKTATPLGRRRRKVPICLHLCPVWHVPSEFVDLSYCAVNANRDAGGATGARIQCPLGHPRQQCYSR